MSELSEGLRLCPICDTPMEAEKLPHPILAGGIIWDVDGETLARILHATACPKGRAAAIAEGKRIREARRKAEEER